MIEFTVRYIINYKTHEKTLTGEILPRIGDVLLIDEGHSKFFFHVTTVRHYYNNEGENTMYSVMGDYYE